MVHTLFLLFSLVLMCSAPIFANSAIVGDDPPAVFDKRSYDEAKTAASEGKKWFIVTASAEWCLPCKQMHKTTWCDEKVMAWLKANSIAVEIDVDVEKKLASDFKIEAMPTIIALQNGDQEFDRVVGYRNPADFLLWVEGMARGEKALDAVRKLAGERDGSKGKVDIRARLNLARSLQHSGKANEAADEYAWLWQHMLEHDPGYYGVRLSFMASDMTRLAQQNEEAKKKFVGLRDEVEKSIAEEKAGQEDLNDWIILNKIVDDKQSSLRWFDGVKNDAHWKSMLNLLLASLEDLLIQDKRWADLGRLYGDPMAILEREQELRRIAGNAPPPQNISDEQRKMVEEMPLRMFRNRIGRLYAGLLAAAREEEARKVAMQARELDDAPGTVAALVSTALEAGQPRSEHIEWLEAALKIDASLNDLLKRTQDSLAKKEKR